LIKLLSLTGRYFYIFYGLGLGRERKWVDVLILILAEQLLVDEQVLLTEILGIVKNYGFQLAEHLDEFEVCSSRVKLCEYCFVDLGCVQCLLVLVDLRIVEGRCVYRRR
jgi:hypothetical protein